MRSLGWNLLLIAAAVALAVVLHDHGGNLLIIANPWRIELSLSLAAVLLLVAFLLAHALLRLIQWLSASPLRLRQWRASRAQRRDAELLEKGWINVLEGRYVQAEKDLTNLLARTRSVERKVLAGLSAARALHLLGEYARRDQVLLLSQNSAGQDLRLRQVVDTVSAEMFLDQNRPEEALQLLLPLQDASSRFLHGTRLLLRAHEQLGHHDQVHELARLLSRRSALDPETTHAYVVSAASARLAAVDEAGWAALWGELSAPERQDPRVALAGAQAQQRFGKPEESARILEAALKRQLDDNLLRAYASCDSSQARQRLGHAELWLKNNPDNPGLLAAMGQICIAAELWGQGEHYLQRSLALRPDTHAYALLGNLYLALGRTEDALQYWSRACNAADAFVPIVRRRLPAADTGADPDFEYSIETVTPVVVPEAASAVYQQDYEPDAVAEPAPGPENNSRL